MENRELSRVRKKKKRRRLAIHHVRNVDISNCSNCFIQGLNFVTNKKEGIIRIRVDKLSVLNSPGSVIQFGQFCNNMVMFGGADSVTENNGCTDVDNLPMPSHTVKSLLMSSWSREQVRCWIMNINLPSYVANQFYEEHVNGFILQKYKKKYLKKDFLLYKSNWRLILYLRKSWLKMEKDVRETIASSGSRNVSLPSSVTYDIVKAKENIQDIVLHLNSKLRSFQDSFTEFNISDLSYLHRGDLRVTSESLEFFFFEILNTGKNNLIVGFMNVTQGTLCDNFIEQLSEILGKIKDTGLTSFILGEFNLHKSSRKLLLYEKNIIGALTDNLFFRLRTESAFIRNSILFDEVITNDTGVFSSDDGI
ncbi:uncharacterized protein LOC117299140 [Asterias rubens]|uniref:uncharacterized protein LOC117299140 n=1 Tax=Asterias rubens TaxID=7604 RepID=UPI0014550109|nr:uncharacterized protein LOC117299140 [Asterias rubens]